MDTNTPFNSQDHDLLIEVNTNVKNLTARIESYTSAINQTIQDHETRIRLVESEQSILKGSQKNMKSVMAVVGLLLTMATVVLGVISLTQR
jgi:endonuclease V-like protein UPF0215 family